VKGILIRLKVKDIRVMSRNTQGVKVIKLTEGDHISAVARIIEEDKEEKQNNLFS
jgi:DNA gyrase subunit A